MLKTELNKKRKAKITFLPKQVKENGRKEKKMKRKHEKEDEIRRFGKNSRCLTLLPFNVSIYKL